MRVDSTIVGKTMIDQVPIRQYGKRELYNLLHQHKLVTLSYNTFMKWIYDDPLHEEVIRQPALKRRKVLLPREVRAVLTTLI